MQGALCFGGRGWIRTIVVCDNGFTVRSLWPLGNPSIINEQDYNSRIHICQLILQCRFIYILPALKIHRIKFCEEQVKLLFFAIPLFGKLWYNKVLNAG